MPESLLSQESHCASLDFSRDVSWGGVGVGIGEGCAQMEAEECRQGEKLSTVRSDRGKVALGANKFLTSGQHLSIGPASDPADFTSMGGRG